MILSHKHRFVFIHVYKVAGTSLAKALAPYGQEMRNGILVRLLERVTGKCHTQNLAHLSAIEVRDILKPAQFSEYYKFAFVRHPLDWLVSYYEYIRQSPFHYRHELVSQMEFPEFVRWRHDHEYTDKRHQKDFVVDEKGELLIDFIGRFESLAEDFQKVCDHLQIAAELPKLNFTQRKDFQNYYADSKTIELVLNHLEPDFEFFGYDRALPERL